MFYIDKLKHLLVMERDSKKFKVYNSKTGGLLHNVPEKNIKGGAIFAADYIEMGNTKYFATCQNNNTINFWDSNNYIHKERLNTSEIQLCLKWCGSGVNTLFSAGCDNKYGIHAYDLSQFPFKETMVRNEED